MSAVNIYRAAWKKLQDRLTAKTSWGYLEVQRLMAECLQEAVDEAEQGGEP